MTDTQNIEIRALLKNLRAKPYALFNLLETMLDDEDVIKEALDGGQVLIRLLPEGSNVSLVVGLEHTDYKEDDDD